MQTTTTRPAGMTGTPARRHRWPDLLPPRLRPSGMRHMSSLLVRVALLLSILLLSACVSGPVRRVSEPSASIQQLSVRDDGTWSIDLRLQNFSNVPMRFDRVSFELRVDGQSAGTLEASPAISVGPESADIATATFTPSSLARIAVAGALADGRTLQYHLEGRLEAGLEDRKAQTYRFKRDSALNPVPGRPGVLR